MLFIILTSCSSLIEVSTLNDENLNDLLGKKITVVGIAVNKKLGAKLITKDSTSIWISDKISWPEGYYLENNNGKTLKVTGTVIEKYDLPVFKYKGEEEDLQRSGIPVSEGTNLKETSHRYLLKNATWEIISE